MAIIRSAPHSMMRTPPASMAAPARPRASLRLKMQYPPPPDSWDTPADGLPVMPPMNPPTMPPPVLPITLPRLGMDHRQLLAVAVAAVRAAASTALPPVMPAPSGVVAPFRYVRYAPLVYVPHAVRPWPSSLPIASWALTVGLFQLGDGAAWLPRLICHSPHEVCVPPLSVELVASGLPPDSASAIAAMRLAQAFVPYWVPLAASSQTAFSWA